MSKAATNSSGNSERGATRQQVAEMLDELTNHYAASLQQGRWTGRFSVIFEPDLSTGSTPQATANGTADGGQSSSDSITPTLLVDATFELIASEEKYRLDAQYKTIGRLDDEPHLQSDIDQASILYLGKESYLVTRRKSQLVSASVFPKRQREIGLDKTGFPASHPVRLWEDALIFLPGGQANFRFRPLGESGQLLRAEFADGVAEYYLFPPEPNRLQRVVCKLDSQKAFEFNLRWKLADGTAYISEFRGSAQLTPKFDGRAGTLRSEVRYETFTPNIDEYRKQLEQAQLGIETGQEFESSSLPTQRYRFDGESIKPIASVSP